MHALFRSWLAPSRLPVHAALSLVLLAPAQPAVDARFVLRLLPSTPDAPARVMAELHVRGDDDGASDFSVPPDWGGIEHLAGLLHAPAFRTEDGVALTAAPLGDRGWRVAHAPGAPLVASWWLGGPLPPLAQRVGNEYRPQVSDTLAHVMGGAGLLRPDALADGGRHRFELCWEGLGAGQRAVCSFGEGPLLVVEETLDAFLNAVFLAGALRVEERQVGGGRLLLAAGGEPLAFADADFADLAARIVATERAFFDDPGDPLFVITLVPAPAPDGRSISLGGTGLTRSFALFVSPRMTLEPGSDDARRLTGLLAHEHFHHWNGGLLHGEDPEGTRYWFSEGFTDFFTRRLLVRSGVWSVAQFADAWNETLAAWWTSPARDAPNARIAEQFWSDRAVGQLPYQRGSLVALLLDGEIRRTSLGRRSLDDFMREAVASARAGEPADTSDVLERAARWTSPDFAERLRATLVDGAPLALDEELLAPALRLEWVAASTGAPGATPVTVPRFAVTAGLDEDDARAGL